LDFQGRWHNLELELSLGSGFRALSKVDRFDEILMPGPADAEELRARRLEGSEQQRRCKKIHLLASRSSVAAYAKAGGLVNEHTER
jgi:hypothetical protein